MAKHTRGKVLRWQATLILTLFFTAVAGAAAIGWWYARESPAHQGPLVLIAVNGLEPIPVPATADALAAPVTPDAMPPASALEALVRDSVTFDRAYTHSPSLLPGLASLLTGRLPFEHGIRDDAGYTLGADIRTLAGLLRNRGFRTAAAAVSPLVRPATGLERGFSSFTESPDPVVADGMYLLPVAARTPYAPADGAVDMLEAALVSASAEAASAALDAGDAWARAQEGQRYFLFLQVDAPMAEDAVARVTQLLRERRLYEPSTIVLAGTRGPGGPDTLDEASLRVPLLVKQPNGQAAGRRVTVPVQHIDILPTILDVVRAPIPGELRGRSLQPLLDDEEGRIDPQPVYSESLASYLRFGGHPLFALTVNDARYVRGSTEQIVRLEQSDGAPAGPAVAPTAGSDRPAAPAADADEPEPLAPMRATLDRLLTGSAIDAPAPVVPGDLERLAHAAEYLPALRPIPGLADVRLDGAAQVALASAHRRAARLVGQRRLPAAVNALQRIVRDHPALASLHYQIGMLSSWTGRTQEAIAAFEEAAALRPDSPAVPMALAASLVDAGRAADAQVSADLAVTLAQASQPGALSAAHQRAARVSLARGDVETALRHADAAQAADPAVPMRPLLEGTRLAAGEAYEEAAGMLQEASAMLHQHDTTLEGVHVALGSALAGLGRTEAAEAAYLEELRAHPRSVRAFAGLLSLYRDQGMEAEFESLVTRMLAASPDASRYAATGRLLAELGMTSRADSIRSEARARFRGDPSTARLASGRTR